MRTFYAEMKKSISDALEKRRQKLLLMGNTNYAELSKENSKEDGAAAEDIIDTSSLIQIPDADELKLGRTISQEDHDKLEKDIEQITHKIVEKSEFLLHLAIPVAWSQDS
jgi:hypothetical protein